MDHFYSTYIIIGITVLFSLKGFSDTYFTDKYLYKPVAVKHDNEWYRIFSHMLLHADHAHLFFNMFALFGFGKLVEQYYWFYCGHNVGTFYFWGLYLIGGMFSTLIPYYRHQENPAYRSLGASGAVSAVIFAAILLQPTGSIYLFFIEMPAYIFGPLYLAFEIWSDRRGKSGIAHDAHIGGALFGIGYVILTNFEAVKSTFYQLMSL